MKRYLSFAACVALLAIVGCGGEEATDDASTSSKGPSTEGAKFVLAEEPEGATDVIQVREEVKDGDELVIIGRIGGSANPWIDGRAAFSIVDRSLRACSDIPGDECPIPWDYCCETDKLPTGTALVKVVDESGALVKADAKQLLGVKELSTVVVKGKAERDDAGNLTVLTSDIYIKSE